VYAGALFIPPLWAWLQRAVTIVVRRSWCCAVRSARRSSKEWRRGVEMHGCCQQLKCERRLIHDGSFCSNSEYSFYIISSEERLFLLQSRLVLIPSHMISHRLIQQISPPQPSPLITVSNAHGSYVGLIDPSSKFLLIVSITSLHFTRRVQWWKKMDHAASFTGTNIRDMFVRDAEIWLSTSFEKRTTHTWVLIGIMMVWRTWCWLAFEWTTA